MPKPTDGLVYLRSAMKKALLLALAGLLSVGAPARAYPPAPANVNFSSERGVPFGLVLDGRPLTRGVARQVHVDQLVPGLHWADFTVPTAYGGAVRFRSRVWLEPGLETSFVLIARPGRPLDLQQVAAVMLYQPPYRGRGYRGNGYDGGRYNSPAPYGQPGYGNRGYGVDNGCNNASPANSYGGGSSDGYGQHATPDSNGYDDNPNGPGNAPGAGYYPGSAVSSYRTLPPQEVAALVQAVRQRPFEASKLNTAKDALDQRSIQTDDLKRLLRALNEETSRIELAKFAYPHVADQQNFDRVYDTFDSEASARDVQQAVTPTHPEPVNELGN